MNEQNSSTPNGGLLSRLMSGKTPQPEFNAENFRKLFCETFNIKIANTDKEGKTKLDALLNNVLQATGLYKAYELGYTASSLVHLVQAGHLNLYDAIDALHKTAVDIDLPISDAESIIYNSMFRALRDKSDNKSDNPETSSDKSDERLNLDRDLTTLPKLPLECLPPLARKIVENIAECQRIDPWIPFSAIVKNAAAIIGANYYYISDNYVTPGHLWILQVSESGSQKSGVTNIISEPLRKYQEKLINAHHKKVDEYEQELETWEEERRLAKQQGEKFIKPKPQQPAEYVIYEDDYTPEKLFNHLVDNPAGILIDIDEFATFVKGMDRYNKGSSEKSITTSMYTGSPRQKTRVGNNKTYIISHAWVSVYATTQPASLPEIFKKEDLTNGFAVRFTMICPQEPKDRKKRREVMDLEIDKDSIYKLFETMLTWPRLNYGKNALNEPVKLICDHDAKLRLCDILDEIEVIKGISGKYSKSLISRYLEQLPRFILILHCLECASQGLSSPAPTINISTVEKAKTIFYAMMKHSAYAWSIILKKAAGVQPDVSYLSEKDMRLLDLIDPYLDKSRGLYTLKYSTKNADGKPFVECLANDIGVDTTSFATDVGMANSVKRKISKAYIALGFTRERDSEGTMLTIDRGKYEKLRNPI